TATSSTSATVLGQRRFEVHAAIESERCSDEGERGKHAQRLEQDEGWLAGHGAFSFMSASRRTSLGAGATMLSDNTQRRFFRTGLDAAEASERPRRRRDDQCVT